MDFCDGNEYVGNIGVISKDFDVYNWEDREIGWLRLLGIHVHETT
jgi:hypothetical protein